MMRPWEWAGLRGLPGVEVGGVFEPPTVGSFSHVQISKTSVASQPDVQVGSVVIYVDQTCTVRVFLTQNALANNDGITGVADSQRILGSVQNVTVRSETAASQVAVGAAGLDIGRIRVPAETWCPLFSHFRLHNDFKLTLNPTVTGVGIGVWATWTESRFLAEP